MPDSVFSSFLPADQDPNAEQPPITEASNDVCQEENTQEETNISSQEFSNFKLLSASRFGLSRVFVAEKDGKKVIIKALKKQFIDNPNYKASLQREYDFTSQLDNRFIRKALGYEAIPGLGDCIIMEYVAGKTMFEHVRVGTLSEKQIKNVFLEICDALIYMNQKQIVHGFLKTENILISDVDGHVKIIDIGVPETFCKSLQELPALEMECVAPEIISGDEFDARADIYSIGKIMELVYDRNLSKQFSLISIHCTQFSKEQRFSSVSELKLSMTKRNSALKLALIILAILLGVAAYVFLPRCFNGKRAESAQIKKELNFSNESVKLQDGLDSLSTKYKLTSLKGPLVLDWTEDSLRLFKQIEMYLYSDSIKQIVEEKLNAQGDNLRMQRAKDFKSLVINEFNSAQDTMALRLKAREINPSDSTLFKDAMEWYTKRVE